MTSHLTVTLRWTKIALWFCKVFTETFLEVRRDIFPLGAVLLSFVLERNHFEGFLHVFFFFHGNLGSFGICENMYCEKCYTSK